MLEAYKRFWTRYFDFEGVSSRSDFWYPVLINFIIGLILNFLLGDLAYLFSAASLIPSLANSVRRLRDAGYHWAFIFISLIPLINLAMIFFFCQPSKRV